MEPHTTMPLEFLNPVFYGFSFMLGACIGSFLNVVVYRVPAGKSIIYPPSHCPRCQHRLAPTENIPVLGWMLLKGFCRHCKAPIALRYPLVEAVTGLLFVLVFWQIGLSGLTLGYWCFFSWLFALALIDWDTLTLPDALTQSGLVAGLVFQLTWGFWETGHWSNAVFHVMTSVQGAVVGLWSFEILLVVATIVFRRQAMGRGDIKLAAMIGAWLGWQQIFLCLFLAALLGSLVGLMWMGGRSGNDRSLTHSAPIPFGPFLAVASSLCALWGNDWLNRYLQLFY